MKDGHSLEFSPAK